MIEKLENKIEKEIDKVVKMGDLSIHDLSEIVNIRNMLKMTECLYEMKSVSNLGFSGSIPIVKGGE